MVSRKNGFRFTCRWCQQGVSTVPTGSVDSDAHPHFSVPNYIWIVGSVPYNECLPVETSTSRRPYQTRICFSWTFKTPEKMWCYVPVWISKHASEQFRVYEGSHTAELRCEGRLVCYSVGVGSACAIFSFSVASTFQIVFLLLCFCHFCYRMFRAIKWRGSGLLLWQLSPLFIFFVNL